MKYKIILLMLILALSCFVNRFCEVFSKDTDILMDKILKSRLENQKNKIYNARQVLNNAKKGNTNINNLPNSTKYQTELDYNEKIELISNIRKDKKAFLQAEQELMQRSRMIESMLGSVIYKLPLKDGFINPVSGAISSDFGYRTHPIFKEKIFHTGIDIANNINTPIKAANSGFVIYSGYYGGYGNTVIINHGQFHGKNISTLYAHLSKIMLSKGNFIKKGNIVGLEGSTGYSTGAHLHFEIRLNGKPVNPFSFVKF